MRSCPLPPVLLMAVLAVAPVSASAEPAVADSPLQPLLEFADVEREPRWVAVNDGVMGGRSQGGPELRDGQLHFSGTLSLANNGGFSSVRSAGARYDLSGGKALVLRVKGDGRRYQLRLATGLRYRGIPISWSGSFDTRAGEWIEVSVPFDSLVPTVFGTELRGPPIDPAKVSELGFLIGDKREGDFALVVDWFKLR